MDSAFCFEEYTKWLQNYTKNPDHQRNEIGSAPRYYQIVL